MRSTYLFILSGVLLVVSFALLFIVAVVRAFAYEACAVQKDNVVQIHK